MGTRHRLLAFGVVAIAGCYGWRTAPEDDDAGPRPDVVAPRPDAPAARPDAPINRPGVELAIEESLRNLDIAAALSRDYPTDVALDVHVTIAPRVIIGSNDPAAPAVTTGALFPGSTVTITNRGSIRGRGGDGGSGGNGGSGSGPDCGRPGSDGGDAIALTVPTTIENEGTIFGGGGGGAGGSGCNESVGGGGGAGEPGGIGGAGATELDEAGELAYCGQDNGIRLGGFGRPGTDVGGEGGFDGDMRGGYGGGYGLPGDSPSGCVYGGSDRDPRGGRGGLALRRNGQPTNLADGEYASGEGPIRGAIR